MRAGGLAAPDERQVLLPQGRGGGRSPEAWPSPAARSLQGPSGTLRTASAPVGYFSRRAARALARAAAGQIGRQLADAVIVADQQDRRDAVGHGPDMGQQDVLGGEVQAVLQRNRRRGGCRAASPAAPASGASAWPWSTGSGRGGAPGGRYGRPWPWPPARRGRSGGDRGRPAGGRSRPISHAAGEAGSSRADPQKILVKQ